MTQGRRRGNKAWLRNDRAARLGGQDSRDRLENLGLVGSGCCERQVGSRYAVDHLPKAEDDPPCYQ